jgi:hypothetical protein
MVIKEMKKFVLLFWSIFISLIMISTVSAVPQVNSNPLMEKINIIEENIKLINEGLVENFVDVETGGLIDLLRDIIEWLINIVQEIINLILEIFNLVDLIEDLIQLITTLFDLIMSLINFIIDIFTPGALSY